MLGKVLGVLGIILILSMSTYIADDYYSRETLGWYEDNYNECWVDSRLKFEEAYEPISTSCLLYLLGWRLMDNYFPTVSEFFAPAPKLNRVEAVNNVLKQDYYYDSWSGRTIKIDSEVRR